MLATLKEVTLPNLKVYRVAWVAALVVAVIVLFTLGRTDTPKLSTEPVAFDGQLAAADLRVVAQQYPQRVAGSDPDNRCGIWVDQQFKRIGLETHIDGFPATVNGKAVALQNVWAVSRGETPGTIIVLANRDVPPLATQGANDNASGVAALLGLARAFTVTAHDHTIIFLCTSGDAYGALGAREFVLQHPPDDVLGVIALDEVATPGSDGIELDGWSSTAKAAPPWLWLLTGPAARVTANTAAKLPSLAGQVLHLAVPTSSGSQGPFVAAGVPAITLTASGTSLPAQRDTVDAVDTQTLTRVGATAQAMVMAIDGTADAGARSGGTVFITRQRTLSGGGLAVLLLTTLLPLLAITVDLFAHCRRARVALRPAWQRAALHLAPWLIVIVIVYAANLVGLLPKSPGAVIPAGSRVVENPRYLRVAVLVVVLVVAYLYATAVERKLSRKRPPDPRAVIFVAHACLVLLALLVALVNPYSLLLLLPAVVLWPLARPGGWARSVLPVYVGLIMIPVVLLYYAGRPGVGWKVWWYFFLLFENRTIPAAAVLGGVILLAVAGLFAHTLHERGLPPGALAWPAIERRGPDRPTDAQWTQATGVTRRPAGAARPRRPRRPPAGPPADRPRDGR